MTVVVSYVSTREGEAALTAAIDEAQRRSSRLIVVLARGGRGDEQTTLESEADALRDRLDHADIAYEVQPVRRGRDVADDMVEIAEAHHAELIVIGLRRRSPVGKLLLGSQAQRILLDATCPVLAVKSQPPA